VGACGAGLSDDELAAVTGGNIAALFPGGWY
jgi:bacteriocin-like protein